MFLSTTASFASCEDGEAMAVDAALKYVEHFIPGLHSCSNLSAVLSEASATENYSITLSCKTLDYKKAAARFSVALKEVEDSACYVKDVTFNGRD